MGVGPGNPGNASSERRKNLPERPHDTHSDGFRVMFLFELITGVYFNCSGVGGIQAKDRWPSRHSKSQKLCRRSVEWNALFLESAGIGKS